MKSASDFETEELLNDGASQFSTEVEKGEGFDSDSSKELLHRKAEETKDDAINYSFMCRLTAISSIANLLFGFDTGTVSGAILYIKETWPEMTNE